MNENQEVLTAYMTRTAEASALAARITEYLDDMGEVAPDDVDWANVGDMSRMVEALREIVTAMSGEDAQP